MYTLLNNQEASKLDLYLPGRLVASLHYKLFPDDNEIMFVYCEAIEQTNADAHCAELMSRALEDALSRRMPAKVACPIALKYIDSAYETSTDSGLVDSQRHPVNGVGSSPGK